jgi:hypothetical protein
LLPSHYKQSAISKAEFKQKEACVEKSLTAASKEFENKDL